MPIIDSQVHTYERDHPGRPWHAVLMGPPEVTGDQMVGTMDAAGVDGAILVSAFTMYHYDASYALEVRKRYPDRFALIKPVDPSNPDVANVIADWKRTPGTVGVRMLLIRAGLAPDPGDPGLNRVLKEAARHGLPVNLHIAGRLDQGIELIRRNPDTQIIVDHLGLVQPHEPPVPNEPWADLPQVLTLAKLPHVAIKISGACTLSREPFPYNDIWDPVCRMINAFGIDRCMWGSDWTRAIKFLTYAQAAEAFRITDRLSASDKTKLMGGTLTRIYGWQPAKA
ncbi:MAG TPA: amidohydrolase family protein [Xanthobacteraceae bacterium]|jgi:predicted TIM-barrel fold metal-dependent hydrolase|nr:amidohydrolase family protein [Xanthobacteraceae bacterium]